ncbi:MAG: hypothetical protein NTW14_03985 [bacterium]|nr:hypothetical protein [bacterium]
MKANPVLSFFALISLLLTGCTATYHAKQTQGALNGDRITVATAQKSIKVGMSGSQVLESLGSPNIISTDEEGREVWVYDKISTEVVTSESAGVWFLGLVGGGGGSGSRSTSQRTLTIIVKFDADKKVRDLAYHSSNF